MKADLVYFYISSSLRVQGDHLPLPDSPTAVDFGRHFLTPILHRKLEIHLISPQTGFQGLSRPAEVADLSTDWQSLA